MKYYGGLLLVVIAGLLISQFSVTLVDRLFSMQQADSSSEDTKTSVDSNFNNNSSIDDAVDDNVINSVANTVVDTVEAPILAGSRNGVEKTTLTFVGDIMVDRFIRKIAEAKAGSYSSLFDNVKDKLQSSDAVVANLEGPVTDFDSISNSNIEEKRFVFTFDPEILPALKESNIKIVSIDNNHILNFKQDGLRQTIENLTEQGISYFGNPLDRRPLYKNINGLDFAFISYNQFISPDTESILEQIESTNDRSDHLIIFAHWGDEYEEHPNKKQVTLAKAFIDSGADLVIGAHPHVIQDREIYKGRYIYYSLGNFIFDQYFNDEVSCGLTVEFEFTDKSIQLIEEKTVKMTPEKVVEFADC